VVRPDARGEEFVDVPDADPFREPLGPVEALVVVIDLLELPGLRGLGVCVWGGGG
jgi:hypothetical protein